MESRGTASPIPEKAKEQNKKEKEFNISTLRSKKLHLPDLWPAFAGWKRGINPFYYGTTTKNDGPSPSCFSEVSQKHQHHKDLRAAIDDRLEQLIQDEPIKLKKAKAVDVGLFASCVFPDVISYSALETAAFYLIWLFFWDDAIDSSGGDGEGNGDDIASTVEAGRKYRDESVAYIRYWLRGFPHAGPPGVIPPPAPTAICESFRDVASRIKEHMICERRESDPPGEKPSLTEAADHVEETDRVKLGHFERSLMKYMDACVVEQAWRLSSEGLSGVPPLEKEFWGWRLGTSSVDALLKLTMILNRLNPPRDILRSKELNDMGLDINKLLICINELFSLKKELRDETAHMNLIPITMHVSEDPSDLDAAVQKIIKDIYAYAKDFQQKKELLRVSDVIHSAKDQGIPIPKAVDDFDKLVAAYQAVVTGVLHFSMESPRYGILEDRLSEEEGGGFLVTL